MLACDGVVASNKDKGYILRRLLRRAIWYGKNYLFIPDNFTHLLVDPITEIYKDHYSEIEAKRDLVTSIFKNEEEKFVVTIGKAKRDMFKLADEFLEEKIARDKSLEVIIKTLPKRATGEMIFRIYETLGLPPDVVQEEFVANGWMLSTDFEKEFWEEKSQHQDLSRTAGKGMFKGGLQDQSEITTRYHTATHLLHASLRKILGDHVQQKGSNITAERLRFDFSHDSKLTDSQILEIENLINEKILEDLPVTKVEMKKSDALSQGALAFFPEKYPDVTNVYEIRGFSKELCGGPHVNSTGVIGKIKITREESAGSGVRRVYAVLST